MHVLTWIACAAACGVLWILQELLGSIVAEALGELLKRTFSPVLDPLTRGASRLLDGPRGAAWRRALTLVGVVGLGGGMLLFFHGANRGSTVEFIAGVAGAGISIAGLLALDARLHAATVVARRQKARG